VAQTIVQPDVEVLPNSDADSEDRESPLFNVVLLDDDEHSYEYVIEMLCQLFLMTPQQAYQNACEVDATGRTIVFTAEEDPAHFAQRQIHGYGADWRMAKSKGPMSAIVEPHR
jgi:ATP-dependent Clp protease adaptor protein ClpS